LEDPGKEHLDGYLKPFVGKSEAASGLPANIAAAPGLDGQDGDVVLGKTSDPAVKAEYEAQRRKRKEVLG
jgi:cell filamentation protein